MSVIVEDDAVVLRSTRYGDTSRIAILLTARHGKLHGIAKGARGPRSLFGAALEVLAECRLAIYLKRDRDLHLIRSAVLLDDHAALARHPVRYHYGCAAVEFADRLVIGQEESPELLLRLRWVLERLERLEARRLPALFKAYQMRFAAALGYRPHLEGCLHCGGGAGGHGLRFSVREGGMLCARHRAGEDDTVALGAEAVALLRSLVGGSPPSGRPRWRPALDPVITRVVEGFLRYHIPGYRGLRSLKSLRDLASLAPGARLAGERSP